MSKHIIIGRCSKCGAIVGKIEEGEVNNFNGVKATNTEIYYVNSCFCSHCKEVKNERRKSMCNI